MSTSTANPKPKSRPINPHFIKDETGKTIEVFLTLDDYEEVQRRLKAWGQIRKELRAAKKKQAP